MVTSAKMDEQRQVINFKPRVNSGDDDSARRAVRQGENIAKISETEQ